MREIKFRAWSKMERKWYYFGFDNLFSQDAIVPTVSIGRDRNTAKCLNHSEWGINPDLEIMQYTGLKDKNGVEVYEGDICKYPFSDHYVVGEVVYFGAMFGLGGIGLNQMARIDIEVIGNIYENPELISSDKK